MRYAKLIGTILVLFGALPLAAQKKQNPDLAKVALLPYRDNTGTKNFQNLPKSLHEAIDDSLRTKFEYIPVDHKVAEAAAKTADTKKHKNADEYDDTVLKTAKGDILISGDFTYDEKQNVIVISTRIRIIEMKETLVLPELKNKVDNTIFDATDKVATLVVTELAALAQRSAAPEKTTDGQPKKDEKMTLTREVAPNFNSLKHTILLAAGKGFAIGHEGVTMFMGASLDYRYSLTPQWFVGGQLRNAGYGVSEDYRQKYDADVNINLFSVAAEGGYYYELTPRLRLPFSALVGYYFGKSYIILSDQEFRKDFRNPMFAATVGAEYLLLRNLSLGLRLATTFYVDQNLAGDNSLLTSLDPQVTVAYVF